MASVGRCYSARTPRLARFPARPRQLSRKPLEPLRAAGGFKGYGINVALEPTEKPAVIHISDTVVRDSNVAGIAITGNGATHPVKAVIERARMENNANSGLVVSNNAEALVRDSVASGNFNGFQAASAAGTHSEIVIVDCVATANHFGILVGIGAGTNSVDVSGTTIIFNNNGIKMLDGGVILSRGDNTLRRNGYTDNFTLTFNGQ